MNSFLACVPHEQLKVTVCQLLWHFSVLLIPQPRLKEQLSWRKGKEERRWQQNMQGFKNFCLDMLYSSVFTFTWPKLDPWPVPEYGAEIKGEVAVSGQWLWIGMYNPLTGLERK